MAAHCAYYRHPSFVKTSSLSLEILLQDLKCTPFPSPADLESCIANFENKDQKMSVHNMIDLHPEARLAQKFYDCLSAYVHRIGSIVPGATTAVDRNDPTRLTNMLLQERPWLSGMSGLSTAHRKTAFKLTFVKRIERGMEGTSRKEEDEKLAIRVLPFVSGLSFHRATGNQNAGYRVNLNCHTSFSHGRCSEKQSSPCRMSSKRPTQLDWFACASHTNPAGSR
jgi:hypothetical protein